MLRLALVCHKPLSLVGGVPVSYTSLADALVKMGVDVELISPDSSPVRDGSPVRMTGIRCYSSSETARTLEYSNKVARYLQVNSSRFDAVHGGQWSMLFPVSRRRNLELPMITKFHGTYFFGTLTRFAETKAAFVQHGLSSFPIMPLYTWIERFVARNSAGLVFITNSTRREVKRATLLRQLGPNQVIYNGVDTEEFSPKAPPLRREAGVTFERSNATLLFLGRLDPLKGVHALVLATRLLLKEFPSIRLIIVGSGEPSYMRYLHNLARPADRFIFMGEIPHHQLPAVIALATMVVFPSVYSSGNTLLEAMSCGRPVLAVRGFGFDELIVHGETGLLIDAPASARSLAVAIRSALEDVNKLERMGKKARAFSEGNLSWTITAQRTAEFVQSLVD